MAPEMDRREFLAATPAALSPSRATRWRVDLARRRPDLKPRADRDLRLPVASDCVRAAGRSRSDTARAFYPAIADDDILHGYRGAAGLPAPGGAARRLVRPQQQHRVRPVAERHVAPVARHRRRALRDKAVALVDRVGEDAQGGRRRRHAALSVRQAGLRPRRSPALRRATTRPSRCSKRSPTSPAGPSTDRTTSPIRPTTRPTTACRRSGTRCRRICSAPTAPTGNTKFKTFGEAWLYHAVVEQVREDAGAGRRARRSRLQPRQHVQQRGDGIRRPRRCGLSRHPAQRLRLPAGDAALRHRRLRPERAVHGARRQPRPRARDAVGHRRGRLRLVGRLQDVALSDALYRRGALRRLDRAPLLQRRRRGAAARPAAAATTTTATTASAAA